MKEHVVLKAPEISHFMNVFDDHYYQREYGHSIREYMKKIREAVKIFEQGDNEHVHLWFSAPRGNIEDWADYEEMRRWNEQDSDGTYTYTRKDYEEEWEAEYPSETIYYKFSFSAYREAIAVALGRRCYIETREDVEYDHYDSMGKYFEWILDQIDICAEKIKAGIYQEEIDANVPYTMRSGTILRRDLWAISSDFKEYDQDELNEEEINAFVECMKDNEVVYSEGMTSGKYFDACLIGYKANGLDCDGLTSRESYLRWSDRRDDGLSKINEDSADELIRWKTGELQEFNGSHPWEIFRGGNSTHVDFGIDFELMHPERADFFIAGYHRQKEVVRMFLALKKAGIHVHVWGAEELCERLTGGGKVGIVPNGVTPRYCQSWFPNERIEDFMNIHTYEDEYEEIVKKTEWHQVTYSNLKQK